MASLTEISIASRRTIRFGIYLVIFLIIAKFSYDFGKGTYSRLFPPKEPGADFCFGPLPQLPFPEKAEVGSLNYTLETTEGKLPEFKKTAKVYSMPPYTPSLSAIDTAREKAKSLGFNPTGRIIVENVPNVYVFEKETEPVTLTMNINNGIFSISYDTTIASNILSGLPPDPQTAISQVQTYLKGANLLTDDLTGPTPHQYLRLQGGQFLPAISQSEANLVRVDLFRKAMDDLYPAVTPKGKNANIWFMISGTSRGDSNIIAAEYHYYPIDESKTCTYPLAQADLALEKLKNGEAFFANYEPGSENITINKVYLAYYDAGQYAEYYQPVVVFEGSGDFMALVSALGSESYAKNNDGEEN